MNAHLSATATTLYARAAAHRRGENQCMRSCMQAQRGEGGEEEEEEEEDGDTAGIAQPHTDWGGAGGEAAGIAQPHAVSGWASGETAGTAQP
ncbi:hypothetical protein chiPu_0000824 [Chiloscyllium punctatum]|uniref:Uncharacterized protein n=1 Tax=Chiloscyllium punctatum TaxID=137246 RepID=A0A401RWB8_CHIPU|nr:hypothetical protein [Chiloscyllium punctatum]